MFIKGFGVLYSTSSCDYEIPLSYGDLWSSDVVVLFPTVRLASSHAQIFRIEKDGCTQGNKVY